MIHHHSNMRCVAPHPCLSGDLSQRVELCCLVQSYSSQIGGQRIQCGTVCMHTYAGRGCSICRAVSVSDYGREREHNVLFRLSKLQCGATAISRLQ